MPHCMPTTLTNAFARRVAQHGADDRRVRGSPLDIVPSMILAVMFAVRERLPQHRPTNFTKVFVPHRHDG